MRKLLLALLALTALNAAAIDTLLPGLTLSGVVVNDSDRAMRAHVRAACDTDTEWGIVWGYTSPGDFYMALLSVPKADSDIYTPITTIRVLQMQNGNARLIGESSHTNGFDFYGGYNSMKIVYDGIGARLYAGSGAAVECGEVPFAAGGVGAISYQTAKCCLMDCVTIPADDLGTRHESVEVLADAAGPNKKGVEGLWEYLDQDINDAMATVGGRYRFVITAAENSGADAAANAVYDVVYVSGESVCPQWWTPGKIRARLKSTIFSGNYDMEWLTSDCTLLSDDVDAQLSDDSAILTLRFPRIGAQLRLRRVMPR